MIKECLPHLSKLASQPLWWPHLFIYDQLEFDIVAGVSNKAADLDNVVKPLLDTYQGIFEEFNDNKVYHIKLYKQLTNKGDEYLYVRVERYINALPLTVVNNKELLERTVQSGKL